MTWDELRSVVDRGFEVGSHTASHPHLPELTDSELDDELRRSKERLEDELERPCHYLAYPFGEQSPRVRAAARAAGYEGRSRCPAGRARSTHGPSHASASTHVTTTVAPR